MNIAIRRVIYVTLCLCVTSAAFADKPLTVDGLVRLIESVDVPALRDGKLDKIEFKEGAYVRRGDLLGRLDESEAKLSLELSELEHQLASEKANSEAALKAARSIKEISHNEFQRASNARIAAPTSISVTEFNRLHIESEKSAAEVERLSEEKTFASILTKSKSVEIQLAKLALQERQIVSPLDGIIVQIHRREGEWVRMGEKVLRIVRIDRLRVEGFVNLHSALDSIEKAPVVFEVEFPDAPVREFEGEIVFMHPEADPVNGQIRVWAEIENKGRILRPGQRGKLKVSPKDRPVPVELKTSQPSETKNH
jgi:macrolide-specific efflux system membrane fusion protein